MIPKKSTSEPEAKSWRTPLILREAERLAIRLAGVSFAGYWFGTFFFATLTRADAGLRLAVSIFSLISLLAMLAIVSIASPANFRRRLADRLRAERGQEALRAGFVLYLGDRRIPADDGIVTFEGGTLMYTGISQTFRLGRSHVESATQVASEGPEKRFEIIFEEDGEGRRIAFDDRSVMPHVWDSQALATALEEWMAHAPADSTFEPPPKIAPPSRIGPAFFGLLPWVFTMGMLSLHLRSLPLRSLELTVTVQLFLGSAGITLVGSLAQLVSLRARARNEALKILLDRPFSRPPLETKTVASAQDDVAPRQTTRG